MNYELLDEYRKLYEEYADSVIPNWRKCDKNDLCRYYSDNVHLMTDTEKNGYFSAIVCKFWNLIQFSYKKQESIQAITYEDCYDCLIVSIIYVLSKHVWDNSNSSLYNDLKAPEKAVSIRMKSISGNEKYLNLFTDKKKINFLAYSLDQLEDESSDGYYLKINSEDSSIDFFNDFLLEFMSDLLKKNDHFLAVILDIICNEDCFDSKSNSLNIKSIKAKISSLDDEYARYFSTTYLEDVSKVSLYISMLKELTISDIQEIVNRLFKRIKNSNYFEE